MATNKKITELPELSEVNLAADDVLAIVDISAGTTHKIRKDTLASALSGVSSITATSPVARDNAIGSVTLSLGTVPVAKGGTGATSASAARSALGLGTIATQASSSVSISGGSIAGLSALATSNAKITGLAVGTALTDSVTLGQAQNASMNFAQDTGGTNAYVIAPSPAITSYVAGQVFYFDADNNNTGATTLNVSGLGVKAVQNSGSALSANQILAAGLTGVIYDGTQFQLLTASVDTSSFVTAVDAASTATALAIALG
jgi:hypothetical protein